MMSHLYNTYYLCKYLNKKMKNVCGKIISQNMIVMMSGIVSEKYMKCLVNAVMWLSH